jgi:hypothetical protein
MPGAVLPLLGRMGGGVRSSQDWGVTGAPEGWAGGGRASEEEEEGGECDSVRAAAQSVTPISSPPPSPQLVTSEH